MCTHYWVSLLQGDGVAALSTRAGLWHYFAEVHGHRTVPVEIWQPVTLYSGSHRSGVQQQVDTDTDTETGGTPVNRATCDDSMEEADGGLEERLMTLREFTAGHLLADRSDGADSTARGPGTQSAEPVSVSRLSFDSHHSVKGLIRRLSLSLSRARAGRDGTVAYLAQHALFDQIPVRRTHTHTHTH